MKQVCGVKHELTYGKKVYSIDPSFIGLGKRLDVDHGRVLENIIYLHLSRKTADIYYGKNQREVDFIVCDGLKPISIMNVTFEAVILNDLIEIWNILKRYKGTMQTLFRFQKVFRPFATMDRSPDIVDLCLRIMEMIMKIVIDCLPIVLRQRDPRYDSIWFMFGLTRHRTDTT